jgi:hypothetical protein
MPRGVTLTLERAWQLASLWYADRLQPSWQRLTSAEATAAFESVGLTGEFWSLA